MLYRNDNALVMYVLLRTGGGGERGPWLLCAVLAGVCFGDPVIWTLRAPCTHCLCSPDGCSKPRAEQGQLAMVALQSSQRKQVN